MIPVSRIHIALGFSLGLHVCFAAIQGLPITDHPDVTVKSGQSQVALLFVDRKTIDQMRLPDDPIPSFIQKENIKKSDAKNENHQFSQAPSEGVVWVEPRYLVNPPPKYPRSALIRNIEGSIVLIVDINAAGHPEGIKVEASSDYSILDHAAIKAVRKWVFKPAHHGNKPIRSRTRIPIHFKIVSKAVAADVKSASGVPHSGGMRPRDS